MKMKVRQTHRLVKSLNQSYSQLCSCLSYALLAICLFQIAHVRLHADAYIAATSNVTHHLQHVHQVNDSGRNLSDYRNGRFLFDAFFGIDTPPIDATDFDDEEDDEEDIPKPCKCGNTHTHPTNRLAS